MNYYTITITITNTLIPIINFSKILKMEFGNLMRLENH